MEAEDRWQFVSKTDEFILEVDRMTGNYRKVFLHGEIQHYPTVGGCHAEVRLAGIGVLKSIWLALTKA
ncbi:hypothetical protein [Aeromonas jandaei]|uniref:hypothetical protein n=1 Tax=Aeromonas jandaei TaxID=650 RepID=UPI001C0576FC|nr:hypothetical protein [Aeromonas jandaei]QWL64890.1 hypothetical protein HQ398_00900 [Aeromonas jandaei]